MTKIKGIATSFNMPESSPDKLDKYPQGINTFAN